MTDKNIVYVRIWAGLWQNNHIYIDYEFNISGINHTGTKRKKHRCNIFHHLLSNAKLASLLLQQTHQAQTHVAAWLQKPPPTPHPSDQWACLQTWSLAS